MKKGKETKCKKIPKNPAGLQKRCDKAKIALSLMFEYYWTVTEDLSLDTTVLPHWYGSDAGPLYYSSWSSFVYETSCSCYKGKHLLQQKRVIQGSMGIGAFTTFAVLVWLSVYNHIRGDRDLLGKDNTSPFFLSKVPVGRPSLVLHSLNIQHWLLSTAFFKNLIPHLKLSDF